MGKKLAFETTKRSCRPHESLLWMKRTSLFIYDECCSCRLVANGPTQRIWPTKVWQQPKTCFSAWHMHPNPHGPEYRTICGQRASCTCQKGYLCKDADVLESTTPFPNNLAMLNMVETLRKVDLFHWKITFCWRKQAQHSQTLNHTMAHRRMSHANTLILKFDGIKYKQILRP